MSNRFYCHFRPILKVHGSSRGGKRGTDCGLTRFAPSSDFSARQLWSFATVQGQILSNKLLMNYIKTVANLDQLSWQFKCALHISVYCSLVGKACDSTYLYSALQCNIPQMATTCNNKCCNMSQSLHSNGWILDLLRQASTTDPFRCLGVAPPARVTMAGLDGPSRDIRTGLGDNRHVWNLNCFFWVCPMFEYEIIWLYHIISNMIFCCMWPLLKVSRFEVIEIGWWQIWIPHRCCLRCPALQNSSMIGTGFRQCQGDHWITHGSPWITIDSEQHWFPLNPDVLIPCKSLFCISKKSR